MSSIEYARLQARDTQGVAARADLHVLAHEHDRPYDARASRHDLMSALDYPFPASECEYWLAYEAGTLVGSTELNLPTRDNLEGATIEVVVHPEHRRRGIGRQLALHTLDRARTHRRLRVTFEVLESGPPDHPGDRAGVHLGRSLGAEQALVEIRRRVFLRSVGTSLPAQLLESAALASTGYHLVTWQNAVPDEIIDGVATLESRMGSDAPMGTLAWEPEDYDADRWRAAEAAVIGRGRRTYGCAAVHSDTGVVAGYTIAALDQDVPEHAWQWGTIVLPDHRGHRLGVRMKAHTQLRLLDEEPAALTLDTWNAVENAPMIAVNEALGYRPLDVWAEWQLELT